MSDGERLGKGGFYHIYNRGNNREDIFLEDENYSFFLEKISSHLLQIADVYAYCLLKNHFHLLVQIKEDSDIEDENIHLPFSNLFNSYAKAINRKYDREGSLFRKNFKRKLITDEEYLQNVILYVHLNPVKHGFTDDFKNYPYSSFGSLISDKPTKLKRDFVIGMFDDRENFFASHQLKVLDKFDLEL